MAIDPIILALTVYGRIYCGLSIEDSEACALKAVEVVNQEPNVINVMDAFDDVWAASLMAGTIKEHYDNGIMHPLPLRQRMIEQSADEEEREYWRLADLPDEPKRPARYKDKNLIAIAKINNKRRHWDKGGD